MKIGFKGTLSKISNVFKNSKLSDRSKNLVAQSFSAKPRPIIIQEDILVQVFLLLSREPDKDPTVDDYGNIDWGVEWDWLSVTEVCRYWRTVVMDTPELWSYLNTRTFRSAKRTETFILRSRESDLTVEYTARCSQLNNLKVALKEIRRIRYLSIDILSSNREEVAGSLLLLEYPAPRLESIKLITASCSVKPRLSFPIITPGVLKNVELSSLNRDIPSESGLSLLSGIRSFSIRYCDDFSLSELFRILETSPRLSSLSIVTRDIHLSSISKSVNLPYLTSVHLEFMRFSDLYDILSNIEAPNIVKWNMGCRENLTLGDVARLEVLWKLLQNEYAFDGMSVISSRSIRSDALIIVVIIYMDPEKPLGNTKGAALELSFDPADFEVAFGRVVDVFGSHLARAETLKIKDLEDLSTVDSWLAVFSKSSFARVVELDLGLKINDTDDAMRCLKALGPGRSGEEHGVPCSRIDHILVKWYGRHSNLDKFLSVLEDVLTARSLCGSAVRTLTVYSVFSPRDDEKLKVLTPWVQELNWTLGGF